ncbi:MAG: imidazolonepropionase [Acidobacteria bacterium]|nr:imidazolonepropionase [Acidobacteriota bacterium]
MLLLRNIAQIVTLRGGPIPRVGASMSDLGIIENGALLIHGDRIVWVGSTKDIPVRDTSTRYQTLDGVGLGLVAMPGFVDSHTHPIFAGTHTEDYDLRLQGKSSEEIAAAGGGITAGIALLRTVTANKLLEGVERNFRHFLSHGTTTIEAKSGFGLCWEEEIKNLQLLAALRSRNRLEIIPTFLGARAFSEELVNSRADYIREIIEDMIPRAAQEELAQFCDVFCEENHFTIEESRSILLAARKAGLGLRIHAEKNMHSGGAKLAAELGARSADHLGWIDDADIEALKRAGTVATLLPGTTFNLGTRQYAPARKLISAGVPVALASNFNPLSCFTMNMQIILAIACTQMKMSPAEAITAATINSAFSLGVSDRLGTLEEDKQADIVLMDISDYRELPYFFGVNHCVVTIKKGNIVINRLEQP